MRYLIITLLATIVVGCTAIHEPQGINIERSSITTVNLPDCDIQYGADNDGNLLVCCTDGSNTQSVSWSTMQSETIVKFETYDTTQKINAKDDCCYQGAQCEPIYQDSNHDDNWAATLEVNDPLELTCITGDVGTLEVQVTVSGTMTLGCVYAESPITLSATIGDNDDLYLIFGRSGDTVSIWNSGSGVGCYVEMGEGNDQIDIDMDSDATFDTCVAYGNQGADTIVVANDCACSIYGGIGNDTLTASSGTCYGYMGTDTCNCDKEYNCEL